MRALFFAIWLFSGGLFAQANTNTELVVLGVAQDAGYPQINCYKPHCMPGWEDPSQRRLATSVAVVSHGDQQKFVFEATPDIKQQFYQLQLLAPDPDYSLGGIFLTHAHMGHYTGLIHLGREAAASQGVPVFVMPRMGDYLSTNGPWSQLVKLGNIKLVPLENSKPYQLNRSLSVTPLLVPHRDEYSETVGYLIKGPNKTALFIPDIDKWQKWSVSITELIRQVDYALLDATFYAANELPNRDMSQVPHPFVSESMTHFAALEPKQRHKVIFIHFNHSNPLLVKGSKARQQVLKQGFRYASEGLRLPL